ncbi:LOW QUALITY PROTEIN: coiled-coil domain-containing protein 57 [Scomber scombrus]|uniref:LOW QUALITY PROTEIN: coiled-coil domain-containing protein 57 n=2 Tax=Scomber scombrus TaxID=13677 RepID=A0AAV1QDG4_SCOSC
MQSEGGCGLRNQGAQVASKERELKELQAVRIHELECCLKKAKEECLTLRKNYQQLKEAFQFNLAILDERDRELERYDVIIDKALSVDHHRQEELSCLRIQVAMLEENKAREAEERLEELSISQHNAAQHKLQLDKLRWIKEIEEKMEWMENKLKKEEDDHIKRYEDVVQALKKCDGQLEAQRQAHTEQLQRAEKHIVKLQENMEVLSAQAHSVQKDQKEAVEQKDRIIQRLRTEVETTRTGWAKYINQASSEMVTKDTELIILQEREAKLRTELDRSREEMERYKQQLSIGLKRERALEQLQVQMDLEWQRRCEELKSAQYLANEQLIQDLTQARDQAKAELNEKEQVLQDLTVSLQSAKKERDQAIKMANLNDVIGWTPQKLTVSEELYWDVYVH